MATAANPYENVELIANGAWLLQAKDGPPSQPDLRLGDTRGVLFLAHVMTGLVTGALFNQEQDGLQQSQ
jgi:hypothetical protein